MSQLEGCWDDWSVLTDVVLLFQHFFASKIQIRELGGIFVEIVEHWDALLAYLIERREGFDITGHNANSVERNPAVDRTLRAQFALRAVIVKISDYSVIGLLLFGRWGY